MTNEAVFEIDEFDGMRIDVFLAENLAGTSRSFVQKQLSLGNIKVNGKEIKANYRLKEGDVVNVNAVKALDADICPENIPVDILYEDRDLAVVNKPKGMVVHPAAGHYSGTLVNALMYKFGGDLSGINGVLRPGIVHRIDMDTSGVLVIAKNDAAHRGLSGQFAQHSIIRVYEAVTDNVIKQDSLTVDKPIGRCEKDRKKMCITDKNSKSAVTHITVIKRFAKNTFVEARLETGRTHQIRVHLSSIGYPLMGDQVYGFKKQNAGFKGQALFARTLGFIHPVSGQYMEFNAERPEYFKELIFNIHCRQLKNETAGLSPYRPQPFQKAGQIT